MTRLEDLVAGWRRRTIFEERRSAPHPERPRLEVGHFPLEGDDAQRRYARQDDDRQRERNPLANTVALVA
jgi:hypothetical protein